jgi:hypothetical protein
MRRYCIGAFLLDRDDPTRVLGRLREPLITPSENEREGYVPNVVRVLLRQCLVILRHGDTPPALPPCRWANCWLPWVNRRKQKRAVPGQPLAVFETKINDRSNRYGLNR